MNIPLPAILDVLSPYPLTTAIPDLNRLSFSWASFLCGKDQLPQPDRLYLCTLGQARRAGKAFDACCFLCILSPEERKHPLPLNCILVEGIPSVIALAELVQGRISFLRDWIAQLDKGALERPTYQGLLDLSEPVLNNPIYILDASYKLLAFTHNTVDDDQIDVSLRQIGYHSEEALSAFRACRRFEVYQNEVGVLVNRPGNPNKYATVGKWLWDQGMPVIHLVMVCSHTLEPTPSLLALFEIMAQNCALRFRQQQISTPHTGRYYESLFHDILFDKLDNPRIIAERVKSAGIPISGNFNCYKIVLQDVHSYPIPRVLDEFLRRLPSSSAISHGYEIIALNQLDAASADTNLGLLEPFLEKFDAVCGVSEPFNTLMEFSAAYIQASRALGIGECLQSYRPVWDAAVGGWNDVDSPHRRSLFYYDDVFVYYALSAGRNGLFDVYQKTPYLKIVQELIESDRENGSNNAKMLYTYLVSERRATQTAQLLHMHRNNVLYRMPRIAEQIGLDLDDYWVRLKLLLAFHLTELEQAHQYDEQKISEGR